MTTALAAANDSAAAELEHRIVAVAETALARYERECGALVDCLGDLRRRGVTPAHYEIYRDNYLYRTATTFGSIVKALEAAARQEERDSEIILLLVQTLYEESGEAGKQPSHYDQLFESHNSHGRIVFGLPPLPPSKVAAAPTLSPEALRFRTVQHSLYSSPAFPTVMGAFLAQESTAESMLRLFFETFFRPFEVRYGEPDAYGRVADYFLAHLDGTERSHARRARTCAARACREAGDVERVEQGMNGFLEAQTGLWHALVRLWRQAG